MKFQKITSLIKLYKNKSNKKAIMILIKKQIIIMNLLINPSKISEIKTKLQEVWI